MAQIVLADGDDWNGMYVDGILVNEGHTLSAKDALTTLVSIMYAGEVIESVSVGEVNLDWLDSCGSFPENIKDVKWQVKPKRAK